MDEAAAVDPSGWFAVELRYAYLLGTDEVPYLVEDRVILVDGDDEETALGRAVEMAPEYEDEFETEDGGSGQIRFEGIVALKELDDPPAAGTEVWHEFMAPTRRRDEDRRGRRRAPVPAPHGPRLPARPRRLRGGCGSTGGGSSTRSRARVLFRFDPERIHRLTLRVLSGAGTHPAGRAVAALAGGVDRQPAADRAASACASGTGSALEPASTRTRSRSRGWAALGLGFVEVGTVTPVAQAGNPRPRLFRLPADGALLNRMGFNNHGAAALARRVMLARRDLPAGVVIGVNIGRARGTDVDRAADDYLACHRLVAPVADYLAVNVSSPNTPGLRDLQEPAALADLLTRLDAAGAASGARPPLLVKLSPDLDPTALEALVIALLDTPAAGVILSNTTTARTGLRSPRAVTAERGGLSGAPLLSGTLDARRARPRGSPVRASLIVASGGIDSAAATRAASTPARTSCSCGLASCTAARGSSARRCGQAPDLRQEGVAAATEAAATMARHLARGAGRTRRSDSECMRHDHPDDPAVAAARSRRPADRHRAARPEGPRADRARRGGREPVAHPRLSPRGGIGSRHDA